MSFRDEFRTIAVSGVANHVAFGLSFLKRGERGEDIADKFKRGIVLAEYLEHGKDALSKPAVCGDDLDPIRDYEVLMSYSDGQDLFDRLQESQTFLAETAKAILDGTEIIIDQERIMELQQLMNRIAVRYVREVSLSISAREGY